MLQSLCNYCLHYCNYLVKTVSGGNGFPGRSSVLDVLGGYELMRIEMKPAWTSLHTRPTPNLSLPQDGSSQAPGSSSFSSIFTLFIVEDPPFAPVEIH